MGYWHSLYASDLQSVYALWLVPLAFLVYVRVAPPRRPSMVAPGASAFMGIYALVFGIETMLDPFASGVLAHWLGIADGWLGTTVMFVFVLLGDVRVLLLVFYLVAVGSRTSTGRPAEIDLGRVTGRAVAWTVLVPVITGIIVGLGNAAAGPFHPQVLWLVYELAFLTLTFWIRARVVRPAIIPAQAPIGAYLGNVLTYVAIYYGLWATADVLIMAGVDVGWALRMVPNQLYYAFYLPVVYGLFFSSWYVETSTAAQASR